jgi:hypothetical protein
MYPYSVIKKPTILIELIILLSSCFFVKSVLKHKQEKRIIENNYINLQKLEDADVANVE